MSGRPGVMIYFDMRPALECLTTEEKGRLFEAILEYAENGIVPSFDGALAMMWCFVKPKLDKDDETYKLKCIKRKYSTYCREAKRAELNIPYLSFNEWLVQVYAREEDDNNG